jgi:hypothetical protein
MFEEIASENLEYTLLAIGRRFMVSGSITTLHLDTSHFQTNNLDTPNTLVVLRPQQIPAVKVPPDGSAMEEELALAKRTTDCFGRFEDGKPTKFEALHL